ncbi:MAG: DUF4861 domain-containing protein [Paramuribaculum sp.]|nr:DUF4861 domain-containing protein [Paramuribaculum sp.]
MTNRRIVFLSAALLSVIAGFASEQLARISIGNKLSQWRTEMVEVDASLLPKGSFIITDCNNIEVPWQLTYDNKVIFPASIAPESTEIFFVKEGKPKNIDNIVYAAFYPERVDDLAWENDFAAYRAYGAASGGGVAGYDVFTKSTTRPVVPERYFKELVQKVSYHIDHGDGMDQYDVGATLGGGASAPIDKNGNIILPGAFSQWRILDNGPLRTTFELIYEYGGGRDIRTISLDAGSPFNHTVCRLENISADSIAAGIVVHKPATEDYVTGNGFAAYSDPTTGPGKGYGNIYIGVVNPTKEGGSYYRPLEKEKGTAVGHLLTTAPYTPGKDFSYYWGSSWSKGRTLTFNNWIATLKDFQLRLDSPLEINVIR